MLRAEERSFDLETSTRVSNRVINDDEEDELENEDENDSSKNHHEDAGEGMGQINAREVSEIHYATQVVGATQVVTQSNGVDAGEMIDRGGKAKAKKREGTRKNHNSKCTSLNMPRKKCFLSNLLYINI